MPANREELRQGLGDALTTALGGKSTPLDQFQASAFEIKTKLNEAINMINADPTLSVVGKNERIAELRAQAADALAALKQQQREQSEVKQKTLESKLFDREFTEGSDAALTVSYRDAAERVAALEHGGDAATAVSLMKQSIRYGDAPLRKALLRAAFDREWAEVVNVYTDAYPHRVSDVSELWDIRHSDRTADFYGALTDVVAFNLGPNQPVNRVPVVPLGNESHREFVSWASENGDSSGEA